MLYHQPVLFGVPEQGLPIAKSMLQWMEGRLARREISPLTVRNYQASIGLFTRFVGVDTPVEHIDRATIETWLATTTRHDGQPLKPSALNTRAAPIRAYFAWAADPQGGALLPYNPFRGVQRARTPRLFPRRLEPDDVQRLLHVSNFRQRTIIMLGLHVGARRAEMAGLDVVDWDRINHSIRLIGKNQHERHVPVPNQLSTVLTLWTSNLSDNRGPMFPSIHGDRVSPNRVGALVTEAAKAARVVATTHSLRHTCAADLVTRGVPLPVIQQLLGHESLATTTRYVVATVDELRNHVDGRAY